MYQVSAQGVDERMINVHYYKKQSEKQNKQKTANSGTPVRFFVPLCSSNRVLFLPVDKASSLPLCVKSKMPKMPNRQDSQTIYYNYTFHCSS